MNITNLISLIYFLGLVFGALFLDLWGAETTIKKGLLGSSLDCNFFNKFILCRQK